MNTNSNRVFTDQFLEEAGMLRVELIERSVTDNDFSLAQLYLEQLSHDIYIMFHSYQGWEGRILEDLIEKGGEAESLRVTQIMENRETAPERFIGVKKDWLKKWPEDYKGISTEISAKNTDSTIALTYQFYNDAVEVHDGLMSRITGLLSEFYRSYGSDSLETMLLKVMNHGDGMDPDGTMPFKEKVEQMIQFARIHLNKFALSEDDQKVTFIQECCGSGAKQVRQGLYNEPRDGARVQEAGPVTYGFKDFPVYCCHEPVMEYASLKKNGVPVFIIDPAAEIGLQPCKIHLYKNPAAIPDHYYQRVGLSRPEDLITSST